MPIEALRSVADNFDEIIRSVSPKRLVGEMARADKGFYFRYFKGYRPEAIGRGRIRKIADKEIFQGEGHALFANLLIIHWNDNNAKLYRSMVRHVQAINEDVEAIEAIEDEVANDIIDDLLQTYRREAILMCVRLNGVRFGEELIQSRLVRGEARGEMTASAETATEDEVEPAAAATDEAPAAEVDEAPAAEEE